MLLAALKRAENAPSSSGKDKLEDEGTEEGEKRNYVPCCSFGSQNREEGQTVYRRGNKTNKQRRKNENQSAILLSRIFAIPLLFSPASLPSSLA